MFATVAVARSQGYFQPDTNGRKSGKPVKYPEFHSGIDFQEEPRVHAETDARADGRHPASLFHEVEFEFRDDRQCRNGQAGPEVEQPSPSDANLDLTGVPRVADVWQPIVLVSGAKVDFELVSQNELTAEPDLEGSGPVASRFDPCPGLRLPEAFQRVVLVARG